MVYSFLQDRSIMVEVDGVKSSPHSLFSGVLQGCIPSPLFFFHVYTVKTGVSFRHSLRHRNSASASVFSTLKSVCLSVKTTLRLSYQVLKMTL
jgi:hypothetical protein